MKTVYIEVADAVIRSKKQEQDFLEHRMKKCFSLYSMKMASRLASSRECVLLPKSNKSQFVGKDYISDGVYISNDHRSEGHDGHGQRTQTDHSEKT